ncbi:hypothetical protein Taro_049059 [Colocasia esculenta]|uniref:HSF-type DNA-binding domain-containing protein n=1 Tax=Colocasia esculenta TaxID=4460 RepID=A0A843XA12_COLES|nr:hypothetical protein [Colocasia esculenta]
MALAAAPGGSPLEARGGSGGGASDGLLSLDAHKAVPAPFLTKTYQLVDDPVTDHIVSWGEDLSTFVVWRPPEFARDLLPSYFKHNNFSSFVRQLNTYGFRKVVPERWEFANEFFRKGEKHLLCEIHRRKTNSSSSPSPPSSFSLPSPHPPIHLPFHLHPPPPNAAASYVGPFPRSNLSSLLDAEELAFSGCWCDSSSSSAIPHCLLAGGAVSAGGTSTALLEDNERLRRTNVALLSDLARMRKLYSDIIYFVQNHVRPVPPSGSSPLLGPPVPPHHPAPSSGTAQKLQRFPARQQSQWQGSGGMVCLKWSTTTCSSSLTIAEEELNKNRNNYGNCNSGDEEYCSDDNCGIPPAKLFGVPLGGASGKRPYLSSEEPGSPSSPATKQRLPSIVEDLGLNLGPPSPC